MALGPPAFPCPHCGARSFRRQPVDVAENPTGRPALAHLSLCSACGENYLAVVHEDPDRTRVETWDYYLDREPALRRVRGYRLEGRFAQPVEAVQLFFVGDEAVTEARWRDVLAVQRACPSALVGAARMSDRLPAALVDRCRAWWSRQSIFGGALAGGLPAGLFAPAPTGRAQAGPRPA